MSTKSSSTIHPDVKNWDDFPASKLVPLPVVCMMLDCSPATAWRRVRQGLLGTPLRIGKRSTRWTVGQIREALMAGK
jgi:predicted DNA-binding transcriptional regulator AlpA